MNLLNILNSSVLSLLLSFYLITNLQWFNYSLTRVVIRHSKKLWHILYFLIPIVVYYFIADIYFAIFLYLIYLPLLIWWNYKLDKKVIFTHRVKRFFAIFVLLFAIVYTLCFLSSSCSFYPVVLPLMAVVLLSNLVEYIIMLKFKHQAKHKLETIKNLKIVLITASYGKTSIKNYLYSTISTKYQTHMTPRSVNTIGGIIKDINENIDNQTEFYIVEAGARQKGDISKIAKLLNPQYVIIGQIGPAHIEYFKTIDNIIHTKKEALQSERLVYGVVHKSLHLLDYENIENFFIKDENISCSIKEKLEFNFVYQNKNIKLTAPLLGKFNATNLYAVSLMSLKLGFTIEQIQKSFMSLKQVPHRLQLIEANGKTILDDSFNGNIDGMLEAINLSSGFDGKKTIVTCGLVESTKQTNEKLCHAIEAVFDQVILTSSLNETVFKEIINKNKLLILRDKTKLVDILAKKTQAGELILFANDAPNYV